MSQKLEKLKLDLVKFTDLRKLEVGYFGEQITLKVKVAKIEFNKVKVGQKLAKTPQLSITLTVGLTFFCLWLRACILSSNGNAEGSLVLLIMVSYEDERGRVWPETKSKFQNLILMTAADMIKD